MPNTYTRDEYEKVRRRADAYAEANMEMQKRLEGTLRELDFSKQEVARLKREAEGLRNTMQIVVNDGNTRYEGQNREVNRLRKLLRDHGISPDQEG